MTTSTFPRQRRTAAVSSAILALTLVLALPLGTSPVDARAGGGFSFGSRGTRTFSMPAPTATAPRAAPIQRTETPSSGLGTSGFGASAQPRRFGFGTGLAAGLLGAGVLGMLTGNGFFGGLGGVASLFGFLVQLALIGGLIWLALRLFRGRSAGPALAGAGSGPYSRTASSGLGSGLGSGPGARSGVGDKVAIEPQDYAAFERSLSETQTAYGREDMNALSRLTTPEMLRYFGSEIEANRSRGLRNDVADAKLLQGDLAEAWREGRSDYATVAMRFSARDTMVDRASERVVSGDPSRPSEATELWTFQRESGGPWLLSAIQQTG